MTHVSHGRSMAAAPRFIYSRKLRVDRDSLDLFYRYISLLSCVSSPNRKSHRSYKWNTLVASVRPPMASSRDRIRMVSRVVADNLVHFLRRWLGAARDLHHSRSLQTALPIIRILLHSAALPGSAPAKSPHLAILAARHSEIVCEKRLLQGLLDIVWITVRIPAALARVLSDVGKNPPHFL